MTPATTLHKLLTARWYTMTWQKRSARPSDQTSKPQEPEPPRQCDRCLELVKLCVCLPLDLEEYERPEVCWVASRSLTKGSPIKHELYEGKRMKYRYQKAVQEVERLNRLYAGRVQHFLMPVKQRDTEDV